MAFDHVVTSEDAKSYKSREEMFKLALEKAGVYPYEVLHVGDSLSSDIAGAHHGGIDSFWLNRKKRNIPDNCLATFTGDTLMDVLELL